MEFTRVYIVMESKPDVKCFRLDWKFPDVSAFCLDTKFECGAVQGLINFNFWLARKCVRISRRSKLTEIAENLLSYDLNWKPESRREK